MCGLYKKKLKTIWQEIEPDRSWFTGNISASCMGYMYIVLEFGPDEYHLLACQLRYYTTSSQLGYDMPMAWADATTKGYSSFLDTTLSQITPYKGVPVYVCST